MDLFLIMNSLSAFGLMQNQSPLFPARWQALNEAGIVLRDELNLKAFPACRHVGHARQRLCMKRGWAFEARHCPTAPNVI